MSTCVKCILPAPSTQLPHSFSLWRMSNVCVSICWPARTPVTFVLLNISYSHEVIQPLWNDQPHCWVSAWKWTFQPEKGHFRLKMDFPLWRGWSQCVIFFVKSLKLWQRQPIMQSSSSFCSPNLQILQGPCAGPCRAKGPSFCVLKRKIPLQRPPSMLNTEITLEN